MKKDILVTLIIILVVGLLSYFILTKPIKNIEEETAKCIGNSSVLYIQLGCHACETQKDLFGENYKYLNVIDCFFEKEKCEKITHTPTWEINRELIKGAHSIEELKQLTGC